MDYPGEKLLIRMWETLADKGVGSLLRPWQIRREGRARIDLHREATLAIAQAERDAGDIRAGRKRLVDGTLLALPANVQEPEPPYDSPALAAHIARDVLADTIRKEVNVAKAILAADAELQEDRQEPSSRKVDDDWLFRWRDMASSVSAEELQNLWGRALAGEIKAPGSFSLRTLDFLRNLSQAEAREIARLTRFAIGNIVFRSDEAQALLAAEGIDLGFLLRQQELGVISGVEARGLSTTWSSDRADAFQVAIVSHGRALIVTGDDPAKRVHLGAYRLTDIGRQIIALGRFEPHEEYLRLVGKAIRDQGFKVQLALFEWTTETQGHASEPHDL